MKIKVAVLFGGDSVEHEVSIISAIQAMNACDESKYEVMGIYISKDRDFYYFDHIPTAQQFSSMEEVRKNSTQVVLMKKGSTVAIEPAVFKLFSKTLNTIDVAIPVMHGTNGEDGTIQGFLEMLKVPYAGCDVIAAGCGQDKVVMKHILQNSGLPVCPWMWIYAHQYEKKEAEIKAQVNQLGYPVIIKPACLGSSVGITIAKEDSELKEAIKDAAQYDNKIVIEKMVDHLREINCSVLGSVFENQVSVLEEVSKGDHEFLDYEKKYLGGGKSGKGAKGSTKGIACAKGTSSKSGGMASTARIVPAPLTDEQTQRIQDLAISTFEVLGASGVCRIDFMMDDTTKAVYVNEINTIPGSLAFYLWQYNEVDFTQLMDSLINQAIDRQRRREKMITSFETNILANYQG